MNYLFGSLFILVIIFIVVFVIYDSTATVKDNTDELDVRLKALKDYYIEEIATPCGGKIYVPQIKEGRSWRVFRNSYSFHPTYGHLIFCSFKESAEEFIENKIKEESAPEPSKEYLEFVELAYRDARYGA